MRSPWWLCCALLGALASQACLEAGAELRMPTPEAELFADEVYPMLLRDCGFPACHGDPRRYFRVFGPGRTRYYQDTDLFALPDEKEVTASYARARSMLVSSDGPEKSLLLSRPISLGHAGFDAWGAPVIAGKHDPRYQLLLRWATTVEPVVEDGWEVTQ